MLLAKGNAVHCCAMQHQENKNLAERLLPCLFLQWNKVSKQTQS